MVKWRFEDVNQITGEDFWEFEISPHDGGLPSIEHQVTTHSHVGPWPSTILQEGRPLTPKLGFSGKILTQSQYEAMERWYMRRILLDIVDDVGRRFRGVMTTWTPARIYKPFDPWHHDYTADFSVWAGQNASGEMIFGYMAPSGVYVPPPEPDPQPPGSVPDIPMGVLASYINPNEVDISWSIADGAVKYEIDRNDGVVIGETTTTFFTDTSPHLGTTYRVRSIDEFDQVSDWSEIHVTPNNFSDTLSPAFTDEATVAVYGFVAVVVSDSLEVELGEGESTSIT